MKQLAHVVMKDGRIILFLWSRILTQADIFRGVWDDPHRLIGRGSIDKTNSLQCENPRSLPSILTRYLRCCREQADEDKSEKTVTLTWNICYCCCCYCWRRIQKLVGLCWRHCGGWRQSWSRRQVRVLWVVVGGWGTVVVEAVVLWKGRGRDETRRSVSEHVCIVMSVYVTCYTMHLYMSMYVTCLSLSFSLSPTLSRPLSLSFSPLPLFLFHPPSFSLPLSHFSLPSSLSLSLPLSLIFIYNTYISWDRTCSAVRQTSWCTWMIRQWSLITQINETHTHKKKQLTHI